MIQLCDVIIDWSKQLSSWHQTVDSQVYRRMRSEQDVRSSLTALVSSGLSLINSIAVYVWLVALFLVSSDHTINYHPCWLHKAAVIQSITERECVLCCKQWLFLQFVLYLSQLFLSKNLEYELGSRIFSMTRLSILRDTCMHVHYSDSDIYFWRNNFSSSA